MCFHYKPWPLGHSTIIIGISQVIIVGVKIQVPVEIQPRQTQRYSQFIISKGFNPSPSLHISLKIISYTRLIFSRKIKLALLNVVTEFYDLK